MVCLAVMHLRGGEGPSARAEALGDGDAHGCGDAGDACTSASEATAQGKSSKCKLRDDGSKADDSSRATGSKRTSAEANEDRGDACPTQASSSPLPAPVHPPPRTRTPPPRTRLTSLRAPPPSSPPCTEGAHSRIAISARPRKHARTPRRRLPPPRKDIRHAWRHGWEASASRPAKNGLRDPGGRGSRPLWVRGGARAFALASAGLRTAVPPASSLNPTRNFHDRAIGTGQKNKTKWVPLGSISNFVYFGPSPMIRS